MKISKKHREICENLGWWINEYENGTAEVGQHSPAGEDFFFTVNVENFAREVEDFAYDFDIDDHIAMWIEAKTNGVSGVPSARELVHDAEKIQEMLDELAEALTADNKSKKEITKFTGL